MTFILPKDSDERKKWPVATYIRDYVPDAIAYLAHLSYVANEQHNPGEPTHWARDKSTDQENTMMRHFLEGDAVDSDGILHAAKVAWRANARLQDLLEELYGAQEFSGRLCGCEDCDGHDGPYHVSSKRVHPVEEGPRLRRTCIYCTNGVLCPIHNSPLTRP